MVFVAGGGAGYLAWSNSDPDVSAEGRVEYACALASQMRERHDGPEDWGDIGQDRGYVLGIAVYGLSDGHLTDPRHPELNELGSEIYEGVTRLDAESLKENLNAYIDRCRRLT